MQEEVWVSSPEPAVGVFTTAGTCQGRLRRHFRDRLRRPLTDPVCRQIRQLSGSGGGAWDRTGRCHSAGKNAEMWNRNQRLTATVTAAAAATSYRQRPAAAHNSRTIRANWGYVRPEKRKVVRQRCPTENLAYALRTSRDVPEPPSIANDRHQQHPANMKLGRALNPRATHGNTLVMRSSLDDDEDQGAEVPAVVRDPGRRARCVPDRPVSAGKLRSLPGSPIRWLTCGRAG